MGLDSFWGTRNTVTNNVDNPEDVSFPRELNLCGGMLSGTGNGSFRGKVYDHIVDRVTGVSLYQEEINNARVRRMAAALERYTFGSHPDDTYLTRDEFEDLKLMFRTYADAGCHLFGWW